ncbi:MAG: DNA-directed RNA polymerase subunit beta' [Candidatus Woykebacteria bacterium RIFCSPHIGHO2_12_FULL_45_10]|uniref:DNA-directed RNA polymerase subunit beta' n=1 Tax=Candidatus Woykebacteria bacterium RIFCSPHIGHO2_12_FULL_45_10 TaxID=1802603 RepID=A0A1G1WRN5_9BACT|nr:MAG: DNA-directed RNA polymerase subunit beta' [Candidatus Woykebacteria bacterium RIFCSPHIGHO2_12_FULL_45_10]
MNEIKDFKALRIILASAEDIKSWSHGEVTKPETINYRTFKPEKDGLFDEKIFGPTKDWECYCGKYKRIRYRGVICDKCGVEVTQSKVRRERMGHIKLSAPVAHVWFFKGTPSKLSQLLDITPRSLDAVVYFAEYLVTGIDEEKKEKALSRLVEEVKKRQEEVRAEFKKREALLDKEAKGETKKVDVKNKEQKELIVDEIALKAKARLKSLKEEEMAELSRVEEINKALSERIKTIRKLSLLSEDEYQRLIDYGVSDFIKVGMGAEALLEVLKNLDLAELAQELREEVQKSSGQKQLKATKRLRVAEGFRAAEINLEWMILEFLPVIPPDLRPMVQLSGGRFATSDLNDLYRRVINRNNRLRRLTDLGAPEIILRNEKRMLQEAVDALIDSSQRPTTTTRAGVQQLRSLSDMLKGKQGRFRQNLLGKRVDYSGRSVIIIAPDIKLNECRLPKEMALELFKPFVLRELIFQGYAPNVKSAKHVFERRGTEVWDILENITKNHPVLLNRAPTLHRLGMQAFYPILTEGNAIGIHPSVTTGYGADFDGDQMAIHIPLAANAQKEAIDLMMSTNNLLRPADGEPIMTPKQDVFLGVFFITKMDEGEPRGLFGIDDAITAYQAGKLKLREPINLYYRGEVMKTTVGRLLFNLSLPEELRFHNELITGSALKKFFSKSQNLLGKDRTVKMIDDLKDLGFRYVTESGLSMSVADCEIIPNKAKLIAGTDKKVEEIERNFRRGLITEAEKIRLSEELWASLTVEIDELTWKNFSEDNPLRLMLESGARGSRDQIKQLAGMRGLIADPLGRIVELPQKSNYREGLDVYEYFTSTRGARKGLVDKALKTADAGYLTRRLVDVAHDVLVRQEDCGTKEGILFGEENSRSNRFYERLFGRAAASDIKGKNGKTIKKAGEMLLEEDLPTLEKAEVKEALLRSVLTCETKFGVCQLCYGRDLSTKQLVAIGTPVGVIAAQSIGEPGTQLTMRTFHLGGIVGLDITQGLPRVDEIFEARTPKTSAVITEIPGRIAILETDEGRKVQITAIDKSSKVEKEYVIPVASELLYKEGDLVASGDALTGGHLDLKILLETKGIRSVQQYIIGELQKVYESQGAPINDKHFETIVRKMSEKVRVETAGDTALLPGELVDRVKFAEENAKVLAQGGEPATAAVVILGITRAALFTESVLSAARFQETTSVLTDAATSGKIDYLRGLKENVIIGRLIPTGERARLTKAPLEDSQVVAAEEVDIKEAEVVEKEAEKVEERQPEAAEA